MDDLISRDALYDALKDLADKTDCDIAILPDVADLIREAPAIDPESLRPHGRWVPEEHKDKVSPTITHQYTWRRCSVCGRRLIGYSAPNEAPYCHCGAKMDADKEEPK